MKSYEEKTTIPIPKQQPQMSVSGFFAAQKISKTKVNKITHQLAVMCAVYFCPISICQGKGFKAFFNKLNPQYQVPCRTSMSKHVAMEYEQLKTLTLSGISKP